MAATPDTLTTAMGFRPFPDDPSAALIAVYVAVAVLAVVLLGLAVAWAVRRVRTWSAGRALRQRAWPSTLPTSYLANLPHHWAEDTALPYMLLLAGKSTHSRVDNRYLDTAFADQRRDWLHALNRQGAFVAQLTSPEVGPALVARALALPEGERPEETYARAAYVRDDGTRMCLVFPELADTSAISYTEFAANTDGWDVLLDTKVEVRHPMSGVIELIWPISAPNPRMSTTAPLAQPPAPVRVQEETIVITGGDPDDDEVLEPLSNVHDLGGPDEEGLTTTSHKRLPDLD